MAEQILPTENDARILREMREWQRNFRGPNSFNDPGGASFGGQQNRKGRRALPVIPQLTAPQYVAQVYSGVAANTAGWSYLIAATAV